MVKKLMSILNIDFMPTRNISTITDFSKDVKKDSIFFALDGVNNHGTSYIDEVISKDPMIIVHNNKDYSCDHSNVFFVEDLTEKLLPFLCEYYQIDLDKFKFIGFTGTNGKTSAAYFCHQILISMNLISSYIGTLGFQNNSMNNFVESKNTTPGVFKIFNFLSTLDQSRTNHICLEVSSHALDQNRLKGIQLDVSSIMNITNDHLDYHLTEERYIKSKLKMIDITKSGSTFVNNLLKKDIINHTKHSLDLINFVDSSDSGNGCFLHIEECNMKQSKFSLRINSNLFNFSQKLFPEFNIQNFIYAFLSIYKLYQDKDLSKLSLDSIQLPKGRMQIVEDVKDNIIIDYAHNPDSFKNILKPINQEFKGIITLFGCGGDRDKEKRPLMLKTALKYSETVIFTSDNNRSESFESIVGDAVNGNSSGSIKIIKDRKKAIIKGCKLLTKDKCLLILGKGHEEIQEENGESFYFSDEEVVSEIYK
jgi:UDP-N-acetylmuramoyl-L-alanyl-D-glutamate--2,6-diaminopimelate ligase